MMKSNHFQLRAAAETNCLYEVLEFMHQHLDEHGVSPKIRFQLDIVAEEIFVNIANYAYPDHKGDVIFTVSFAEEQTGRPYVSISFSDQGIFFDPLAHEDPDTTLSAAEREIGGLGILMVKKYMDGMYYEYKDGSNILTMKKYLD